MGGAKVGAHRDLPATLGSRPELWGADGARDTGSCETEEVLRREGESAQQGHGAAAQRHGLASATWTRTWWKEMGSVISFTPLPPTTPRRRVDDHPAEETEVRRFSNDSIGRPLSS